MSFLSHPPPPASPQVLRRLENMELVQAWNTWSAFLAPYLSRSLTRGDLSASTGPGPWRRTADGSRWLFTLPPEQDVD